MSLYDENVARIQEGFAEGWETADRAYRPDGPPRTAPRWDAPFAALDEYAPSVPLHWSSEVTPIRGLPAVHVAHIDADPNPFPVFRIWGRR